MPVEFFNPADETDLAGLFSDGTIQNVNISEASERVQALDDDGDELCSKLHGKKKSGTVTFKCVSCGGSSASAVTLPDVGSIVSGWHIDQISVRLSNADFPEVTLTVHKHTGGSRGSHTTSCRTYTPSLTITNAFGATAPGCTVPDTIGVTSVEYTISCTHQDENGGDGEWLAAENRDGVETLTVNTVGYGSVTGPTGWDLKSDGDTKGNQAAESGTWSFEHHIAANSSSAASSGSGA